MVEIFDENSPDQVGIVDNEGRRSEKVDAEESMASRLDVHLPDDVVQVSRLIQEIYLAFLINFFRDFDPCLLMFKLGINPCFRKVYGSHYYNDKLARVIHVFCIFTFLLNKKLKIGFTFGKL